MIDLISSESEKLGPSHDVKKPQCMNISTDRTPISFDVNIIGEAIKQVARSRYLGSTITSDGRCKENIEKRTVLAKQAFKKWIPVLENKFISIKIKTRVLKW